MQSFNSLATRVALAASLLVTAACGDRRTSDASSADSPAATRTASDSRTTPAPDMSAADDSVAHSPTARRDVPTAGSPRASSGSPASTPASTPASPLASTPVRPAPANGPRRVALGDIDLTGVGHDRGSPGAPVVIIDFSDFGCPYCGEFSRETYPAIEREYVRTGKVFFKYVPFVVGTFPHSPEATRTAECAAEQNRFWPMLDRLYARQRDWKQARDPVSVLGDLVQAEGLDKERFAACYASGRTESRTERATEVANELGVRVTPSFLVDERPVQGALPLAEFRRVIDAALLVRRARR